MPVSSTRFLKKIRDANLNSYTRHILDFLLNDGAYLQGFAYGSYQAERVKSHKSSTPHAKMVGIERSS